MALPALTTYWILPRSPYGPLGFGVTAWSLDDALRIIHALGYGNFLPDELSMLTVREGVTVADLDHNHVVLNMGPIAVRGMWYPFLTVGMPKWADDRMRRS